MNAADSWPFCDLVAIFVFGWRTLNAWSRKPRYAKRKIADALTPRAQVHTVGKSELGQDPIARADKFFTEHPGIHKLLVVDGDDHLHGLFTMSDIERITQERNAQFKPSRDAHFRLLCGAAVGLTAIEGDQRILAFIGIGVPFASESGTDLPRPKVPALFVVGENDVFGPPAMLSQWAGDVGRIVVVPGADHFLEGKLDELEKAIAAFLAELPARRS